MTKNDAKFSRIQISHNPHKVKKDFRRLPGNDPITLDFRENLWTGIINFQANTIRKSGIWIPAPEGQKMFCPLSFHFQILHTKLNIFVLNHFENKDMQFSVENLKMKRKRTTIFLTFRSGDFLRHWLEFLNNLMVIGVNPNT